MRELGVEYKQLEDTEGLLLAVIESSCRYLRPAQYDQEITVETTVGEVTAANRSVRIRNPGQRLFAGARERSHEAHVAESGVESGALA